MIASIVCLVLANLLNVFAWVMPMPQSLGFSVFSFMFMILAFIVASGVKLARFGR